MNMKKFLAFFLLSTVCFFATNVAAGDFLADRHAQLGVKCAQCHSEKVPAKAPAMQKCLVCHGGSYEELAKLTEKKEINPHYTHIGDKECVVCHKGHKASELICNDCHKFKIKVP